MKRHRESCPTCGRPFKNVKDYPQVLVLGFERLPVPEAVDAMSEAAAQRQARRRIERGAAGGSRPEAGINMTPVVAQACATAEVQGYLSQLESLIGQAVTPSTLRPTFPADGHFRWAYPVADTGIYVSLAEAEPAGPGERAAHVEVHCEGPNLGSAGGPTLQELGAIARVRYRGLLDSNSTQS
jgi:hypothetical protein